MAESIENAINSRADYYYEHIHPSVKYWTRTLFLMFNGKFETFKSRDTLGYDLPTPSSYKIFHRIHFCISMTILCNILLGTISYMTATRPNLRYDYILTMLINMLISLNLYFYIHMYK